MKVFLTIAFFMFFSFLGAEEPQTPAQDQNNKAEATAEKAPEAAPAEAEKPAEAKPAEAEKPAAEPAPAEPASPAARQTVHAVTRACLGVVRDRTTMENGLDRLD
ncbi:hypothetical protein IKP13_10135, partial [bacterium]|nr:hypothetical protein [bacterium]